MFGNYFKLIKPKMYKITEVLKLLPKYKKKASCAWNMPNTHTKLKILVASCS